jgi:hypothetical protein
MAITAPTFVMCFWCSSITDNKRSCAILCSIRRDNVFCHCRAKKWVYPRVSKRKYLSLQNTPLLKHTTISAREHTLTSIRIHPRTNKIECTFRCVQILFDDSTRSVLFCSLILILLMWRIGWAPNSIPIYSYIQQDATLHSLFISENCSKCFVWYFHPSSGAHTTVSTASGVCHTVTAICRYQLEPVWVLCGGRTPPTAHSTRFQLFHDSGR